MKPSVALIGPGRVGSAICKRLQLAGYPITAVISRDHERAKEACGFIGCPTTAASTQPTDVTTAQIILLAIPDDQVKPVAQQLQSGKKLSPQTTLVHFSGIHPAEIMRHHDSAAMLLSLHPLLPFADRQIAFKKLPQCPFGVESSNDTALALGKKLVDAVGGQFFPITSDNKKLYHAAACIASNYLITLLAAARDLLVKCDIETEQAIPLLLPLMQASLDNVKELGIEDGLTGPIVRGDTGTVADHLQALQREEPALLSLYQQLGKQTVKLSQKAARIDSVTAATLDNLLSKKSR